MGGAGGGVGPGNARPSRDADLRWLEREGGRDRDGARARARARARRRGRARRAGHEQGRKDGRRKAPFEGHAEAGYPFSCRYLTRTIPSEVIGNSPTAFHVSTRGEYGMRLMVDLAKHWGQGAISLHTVAAREDLPEAYLEQLVAALRKAGLVNGKRGAGGGYTLARAPGQITAGHVVRALEGPVEATSCNAERAAPGTWIPEPDGGTRLV